MSSTLSSQCSWRVLLLLFMAVWLIQATARVLEEGSMKGRHERWIVKYKRAYKDEAERKRRFEIFKRAAEYVDSSNAVPGRQYKLGVNEFADLTVDEFKARYTGFKPGGGSRLRASGSFMYENVTDVPTSMDWRAKGAVTNVKNQGHCGSCWAFSAVAAMEGIHQIKNGTLVSLSEQELVDCDKKDGGCGGGLMDNAFEFIVGNGGLASESDYPYLADDGTCDSGKLDDHAGSISGYEDVPENNETALLVTAAHQPVSVAIDAGGRDFMLYSSGVFTGGCGYALDHGVAVVGYGNSSDGLNYWLVKNSWGTLWGEDGYIRMQRGVAAEQGLCGIAMSASFPTA